MRAALPPGERTRTPLMMRARDWWVRLDRRPLIRCPTRVTQCRTSGAWGPGALGSMIHGRWIPGGSSPRGTHMTPVSIRRCPTSWSFVQRSTIPPPNLQPGTPRRARSSAHDRCRFRRNWWYGQTSHIIPWTGRPPTKAQWRRRTGRGRFETRASFGNLSSPTRGASPRQPERCVAEPNIAPPTGHTGPGG